MIVRNSFISVVSAGIWINLCEFIRNELLFKYKWVEHFASMGLVFPSETLNNVMWVIWGFSIAFLVWLISRRFSIAATFGIVWFACIFLMWIVTWNLSVLPLNVLWWALPLSMVEVYGAVLITRFLSKKPSQSRLRG